MTEHKFTYTRQLIAPEFPAQHVSAECSCGWRRANESVPISLPDPLIERFFQEWHDSEGEQEITLTLRLSGDDCDQFWNAFSWLEERLFSKDRETDPEWNNLMALKDKFDSVPRRPEREPWSVAQRLGLIDLD